MSKSIQQHNANINRIHCAIDNGDDDELEECGLILINPELHGDLHYFDHNSESAVAHAIKKGKKQYYDLFVSQGLNLCPHEAMDELVASKSEDEKKELRDINRKYFKDSTPKHILILLSKSKLSHESVETERREYAEKIFRAYEELNLLEIIEPILKVVSTSRKLQIVFDFKRNTVERLDPTKNRNIFGTTYPKENYIYIGAKKLLNEVYSQALGTLAHEFCHFAMSLLYNNNCKPYQKENQPTMIDFTAIVSQTKTKKNFDKIVNLVFNSPEHVQHAELIVRVPQLKALYKNDDTKFKAVYESFEELFQYYEGNTLVDLRRDYPIMIAKQELIQFSSGILKTLRHSDIELSQTDLEVDFISNDNLICISSNCPRLTIHSIFQKFKVDIDRESIIILSSTTLRDERFFDSAVKTIKLSAKPKIIIYNDFQKIDEIKKIIQKFKENRIGQGIVFVTDQNQDLLGIPSHEVKHSWSQLTTKFQQKILQKKINFQNNEIKLESLMKDLNLIDPDSIPFNDFLFDKDISIATIKTEKSSTEFVERKFLSLNSIKRHSRNYDVEHDINEVLNFEIKNRTILLSDEPGMGKSSTFKVIQSKLMEKYPTRWVVFIDLNHHCKAFHVGNENTIDFMNHKKVTNFLCHKILKINGFEAQVFVHLFNDNRVIILMDGLDEICPSYKNPVYKLMSAIQKVSSNQLWISTRPHLLRELNEILNPITFKLKPFTEINRHEFFKKAFKRDKEDENIEQKIKKAEDFLSKFRGNNQGNDSVSNPLLFKMIAECCHEDQIMELSNANLYSIYKQFTNKMINRCLDKGMDAENIRKSVGNLKMVKFYQEKAFRTCFDDEDIKESVSQVIKLSFFNTSRPSLDDIQRVGLIFSEDSEDFQFIHKSFAEFYVVKYFYKTVFLGEDMEEKSLKSILELLMRVLGEEKFLAGHKMIRTLLDNAFNSNSDSYQPNENFRKLNSMIGNISIEINHEILQQLIAEGHLNLIKIFINHIHSKPRDLLISKNVERKNVMLTAVQHQSKDFIELFFKVLEEFLTSDQLRRLLLELNKYEKNIFHFTAENDDPEVLNLAMEKMIDLTDRGSLVNLLMQSDRSGQNIIMTSLERHSVTYNDRFFAIIGKYLDSDQFEKLLLERNKSERNVFHFIARNRNPAVFALVMKKVIELTDRNFFSNLLMQSDKDGRNPIMTSLEHKSSVIIQRLFSRIEEIFNSKQLRELLLERDGAKKNVFQFASWNNDPEVLSFVMKKTNELTNRDVVADLLMQCDKYGQNLIMASLERHSVAFNERFLVIIREFLDLDQIKKLFLQRDKNKKTVFHYALENYDPEVLSFALKKITEQTDRDSLTDLLMQSDLGGQNILMKSLKHHSVAFNKRFFVIFKELLDLSQLRQLFLDRNKYEKNVFLFTAGNNDPEVLGFALKKMNELTDRVSLANILMQSDQCGQNLIMTSLERHSVAFNDRLFTIIGKFLDSDQLRKLLLKRDEDGRNVFHFTAKNHNPKVFTLVIKKVNELADRSFLANLLMQKDEYGQNILMTSLEHKSNAIIERLFALIEKCLNQNQLRELLLDQNEDKKNILHFASWNDDPEVLGFIMKKVNELKNCDVVTELLMQSDKYGQSIIMKSLERHSVAFNERLFAIIVEFLDPPKFKELLLDRNEDKKNVFHFASWNYDPKVLSFVTKKVNELKDRDVVANLLMQRDKYGQSIIMKSLKHQSIAFNDLFFNMLGEFLDINKIRKLLLERDEDERNVFHFTAKNQNPKVLGFAIKKVIAMKKTNELTNRDVVADILMQSDKYGQNILMKSLKHQSVAFNELFFITIGEFLDSNQLRQLLLELNKYGKNIFHFTAENDDPEVLRLAISKLNMLTNRDTLTNFLMQSDQGGQNLIMKSLKYQSAAYNEIFFTIIGEFLELDQIRKLLLERNKYEKNVIHFTAENNDSEVFSFVVEKINELTDRVSLANFLMQSDQCGQNLIMTSLERHSVAFNDRLFTIIGKFLDPDQLRKLFLERNIYEKNIIHFTAENTDSEILNFVVKKINELTDCEFVANLLMQKDKKDQNILLTLLERYSVAFIDRFFAITGKF